MRKKQDIKEIWKRKQSIAFMEAIVFIILIIAILIGVGSEILPYSVFTHFLVFMLTWKIKFN